MKDGYKPNKIYISKTIHLMLSKNKLDDVESNSNEEVFSDSLSSLNAYITATLMPDCELIAMIRWLNEKQRAIFTIFVSWAKCYVKCRSAASPLNLEPLHIFLIGGKSFLMKVFASIFD